MNFISQNIMSLTSGGKIYIVFQIIYILCGIFFMWVQISLLKELKTLNKNLKNFEVVTESTQEYHQL